MAKKYLDDSGLSYFWDKLKAYFQVKLVSGTNIKTINSESILGSGDITISGGGTSPSDLADYIVEQGTSGIWTYRKWNSGISECWGTISWTITSWTAWGNTYYSTYSSATNYPSGLFTDSPRVMADKEAGAGDSWLASRSGATYGGTKDHTPVYFLMRASTGTNNIAGYVHVHAIGTWQ